MLEALSRESTTEPSERSRSQKDRSALAEDRPSTADAGSPASSVTKTTAFRLGRLLYGGILAFMAVDGLRNAEPRVEYAEAKGVPMPELSNTVAHGLLLAGGLGIALWRLPRLAATAVATFFLGTTPMIHDFWAVEDPEQKQQQMTDFLKNAALLGAALAVFGIAGRDD